MSPTGADLNHPVRSVFLVFALGCALAVGITWPLGRDLAGQVFPDLGDPLFNAWILQWNATTLPLSQAWWNAPVFFPAHGVMAFSEHLLGLSPIASPIIWLSGNPLLAYNITLLLTFSLSATAAYLLGLELTGRRDAALICGLAFGFAPYRAAQLSHLQVLSSFWMPIALLGLHRYLHGSRKWLAVFGGACFMQGLSNGYYLVFLPILCGLWCLWFVRPRHWRRAAAIGLTWIASVLVQAPILLKVRAFQGSYSLKRDLETIQSFSADLLSGLDASSWMAVWGGLHAYVKPEGQLFTGVVVIALVVAGALSVRWPRSTRTDGQPEARSMLAFYVLGALMMYALALGPTPTFKGQPWLAAGPYAWLMKLPGFDTLRVPSRFAMLMVLCLSAAAALGYALISATWSSRQRWLAAGVLGVTLIGEGWAPGLPIADAPRAWSLEAHETPGALLVLPMGNAFDEIGLMYRAMPHSRPLVNGYSGYEPPWYWWMRRRFEAFDPAMLDALAAAGVTQVAVVTDRDRDGVWRDYVLTRATFRRTSDDGAFSLYDLPKPSESASLGPVLPATSIEVSEHPALVPSMTDGDPATFWHSKQPQSGGEFVLIDLGSVQRVAAIEASLGRFDDAYPRDLVVEVSLDSSVWQQVWRGPGDSRVPAAKLRGTPDLRLRFPAGGREARYLRLRQVGSAETSSWTIAELSVRGVVR